MIETTTASDYYDKLILTTPSLQRYETGLIVAHVLGGITQDDGDGTEEQYALAVQIAENLYEWGYRPPFLPGERAAVYWGGRRRWVRVCDNCTDGSVNVLWDAEDSRGQGEGNLDEKVLIRDPLGDPIRVSEGHYTPEKGYGA